MSILRLLASRPLPCGCIVGTYETYAGSIEHVLDSRNSGCTAPTHRPGQFLGRSGFGTRIAESSQKAECGTSVE